MVIEEGKWGPAQAGNALSQCGGGALCPGGDHQTGLNWVTGVSFYEPITDPVVFGIFQTHTGGNWFKPRLRNVNGDGFDFRARRTAPTTATTRRSLAGSRSRRAPASSAASTTRPSRRPTP